MFKRVFCATLIASLLHPIEENNTPNHHETDSDQTDL
jgi:hypothetical protein